MSDLTEFANALATGDMSSLPKVNEYSCRAMKYMGRAVGVYTGELPKPVTDFDAALYQIALLGVGGGGDSTALLQQIAALQEENASLQGQVSALTLENTALQTEAETALDEINGEVIEA